MPRELETMKHDIAGRRELLKAGLASAVALMTGTTGRCVGAGEEQAAEAVGPRPTKPRVIDVHCHPRWIGHNGAKMIENMDAAGIERAWLLSWELPEREMSPGYYATLSPTGVGIP